MVTLEDSIVNGYYLNLRSIDNSSSTFRFSKRNPARNVSTSLIGGTTKGDSNSFEGGKTEFTGEERRSNGALFSDAPKGVRTYACMDSCRMLLCSRMMI